MATLYFTATSLDGFIATEDDSLDWLFPLGEVGDTGYGEALNEDITADTAELEACRWFTRDEVFAMIEGRHPDGIFVPPTAAIASLLIRNWAENG